MRPNILVVAQVEDRTNIDQQIAKQTVQPNNVFVYVDENPAQGIDARRLRIAENHKKLEEAVRDLQPDLVWQLEGDCELPENCLKKLLKYYKELKDSDFGYISGIQVGRHGLYCLGAWTDFTEDSFLSLDHTKQGIQPVDATGFYCLLAPTEAWLQGQAEWNGEPYGPDVAWGLSLRAKGYKIYADMDIHVGHIVKNGIIRPSDMSTCNVAFSKINGTWKYKQL